GADRETERRDSEDEKQADQRQRPYLAGSNSEVEFDLGDRADPRGWRCRHHDCAQVFEAERVPDELSGGERQRVAVTSSLIHEPSVLFADEPTGALDSLSAERLLELVVGIAEESSLTLLIVTHDPRVAAYGQREVVVRDGRTSARSMTG
ncbi:MAG TPA: ATP-binding cassette domain-containing protein, partial [Acidimicrobiia bacterium]